MALWSSRGVDLTQRDRGDIAEPFGLPRTCRPHSGGLAERPKPTWAGAIHRWVAEKRRMRKRYSNDQYGFP
jgi:hypothetical protein